MIFCGVLCTVTPYFFYRLVKGWEKNKARIIHASLTKDGWDRYRVQRSDDATALGLSGEVLLYDYYRNARDCGIVVTREHIIGWGLRISEQMGIKMKFSGNWLRGFCCRWGLSYQKVCVPLFV